MAKQRINRFQQYVEELSSKRTEKALTDEQLIKSRDLAIKLADCEDHYGSLDDGVVRLINLNQGNTIPPCSQDPVYKKLQHIEDSSYGSLNKFLRVIGVYLGFEKSPYHQPKFIDGIPESVGNRMINTIGGLKRKLATRRMGESEYNNLLNTSEENLLTRFYLQAETFLRKTA